MLTRLVPVVRTLVPAIAGASGLPYRRFLPASLVGSLLWASTWVLAGNVVMPRVTEAVWSRPSGRFLVVLAFGSDAAMSPRRGRGQRVMADGGAGRHVPDTACHRAARLPRLASNAET